MIRNKCYKSFTLFMIIIIGLLITTPQVFGEEEPILKDYQLPAQSWKFIEEINFTENVLVNYEWRCVIEVKGVGVTKADFQHMQGLGLTERSAYFEQLTYYEGLTDSGKLTTDENGSLYFIFFNPETSQTSLTITYEYRTNLLAPWAIGLIITIVTVIVLSIAFYYAIKLRNKMIHEAIDTAEESEKDTPEGRYLG
ncbi:MAG: hypothetical protein ACTSXA_05720 [Candidatus Heimdallarchaeota archaeon]